MTKESSVNDGKAQPGIRTKLFIANETIGVGKIDLLELLGQVGSISAAAREMNMSYKRARFLLDSMQSGFHDHLYLIKKSGSEESCTTLTPLGKDLIRRYRAHACVVDKQSAEILAWMNSVQVSRKKKRGLKLKNAL